jgi:hypothetical protein
VSGDFWFHSVEARDPRAQQGQKCMSVPTYRRIPKVKVSEGSVVLGFELLDEARDPVDIEKRRTTHMHVVQCM